MHPDGSTKICCRGFEPSSFIDAVEIQPARSRILVTACTTRAMSCRRRRPAPHRYLCQSGSHARAPASSSKTTAGAARRRLSKRFATRAGRCLCARHRRRRPAPNALRRCTRRFRTSSICHGGALWRTAADRVRRSLTRARVQQYQRYFSDAERVLILLHNDPDPDAHGERAGAPKRAPAHQNDRDHRRRRRASRGRKTCGW